MARISTYIKDTGLTDQDLLVGSNYISGGTGQEIYETANFTLDAVKSYIGATGGDSTFLKETTMTFYYGNLNALNGGGNVTSPPVSGHTQNSAYNIIGVIAYLEAGSTPFNLSENSQLAIGLGGLVDFYPKFFVDTNIINSTTSVYANAAPEGSIYNSSIGPWEPEPMNTGITLAAKFYGGGDKLVTQGNGKLTLKILYRLIDFS
jgi:hypothetical protein